MKEKIKIIVVVVIFIAVLLLAKMTSNNFEKTLPEVEDESDNSVVDEYLSNVTTTAISSYSSDEPTVFYTNVVEEEKTGEVFEVTEENFAEMVLKSDKKVLVEFYADWCGPCKTLSPILEDIAKENLDIKVVKINVDESPNLATTFGANYIPYLVVIEEAKEINSAVGALPKKQILELVK